MPTKAANAPSRVQSGSAGISADVAALSGAAGARWRAGVALSRPATGATTSVVLPEALLPAPRLSAAPLAAALLVRAGATADAEAALVAAADFAVAALRACCSLSIWASASGATVVASKPPLVARASARSGLRGGVVLACAVVEAGDCTMGAGASAGCGAATGDCIGISAGAIISWAFAGVAAMPTEIASRLIMDRRPAVLHGRPSPRVTL